MIPTDQLQREETSEKVIAEATEALSRAQLATEQAAKAIQAVLKAGEEARLQLTRRRGKPNGSASDR